MDLKNLVFRTGLSALSLSRAARLAAPLTRGVGAILMFHHVRPYAPKAFEPNRMLEITPEFLNAALTHLKVRGYEIIPIDAMAERIANPRAGKPFAVLTFDDGYRDNAEHALPVLRRHNAPFTVFATTGFADGTAPLWWLDLEEAAERGLPGAGQEAPDRVFRSVYHDLRPKADLRQEIARLSAAAGADSLARTKRLCLDWDALRELATEPLCSVGAHTLTHPLLGPLDEAEARREMAGSKAVLEERLGKPIHHIAYPVGDPLAAGAREFALASGMGFVTGVTTRPGVLFTEHASHLHALPRLSVNGLYQSIADFDVLLSGAAFWVFNRGRKLNVA